MILAETRKPDTKLGQYRRDGKVPAIVYGHGVKSVPVLLDLHELQAEIKKKGSGSLLDVKMGKEESFKVLLQDTQKHPVKGDLMHVDLYRIKMDEKLTTEIALEYIGDSEAVKLGGVIIKSRDYLHVECLPQYLVGKIEVDVSVLKDVQSSIKVADIKIPEGITVLDTPELVVANVSEVKVEEEEITKEAEEEAIEALGQVEGEDADASGEKGAESKDKKQEQKAEGGQDTKQEAKSEDKKPG